MNCCCTDGQPDEPTVRLSAMASHSCSAERAARTSSLWRIMMVVRWALPVTVLAFIPKCPACVAAYALLFTGISISVSAGNAVRWTVIALCTAVLARLVLRAARRALLA